MGLLSDPSLSTKSQLGANLSKHGTKICILLYLIGLAWFVALAHNDFNHSTYLSENALSPGLVYLEMKHDSSRLAQTYLDELKRERQTHTSTTPHAWIAAKMRQIGLETHMHNFTLHYPSGGGKVFHGKNVYGILRAPRISSTEGIVLTVPYRLPNSVDTDITASVPILLAFADFARRKNYWAKDIIFLVTEKEQLGMHAWLEAYYEGGIPAATSLECGTLPARAGALQAALNLEVQDLDIDFINVKIEGLNGQLPNLDFFNLVQRITSREGISSGYKHSSEKKRRAHSSSILANLQQMAEMLFTQTSGMPNGNHGLFHRYRIEALTLEAVKRSNSESSSSQKNNAALALLKVIEGTFRSLNNLLERFHQSYFFYILVQNDRFVSIGDYMPCLGLLVVPIFIKAFLLWLTLSNDCENKSTDELSITQQTTTSNEPRQRKLPYSKVLVFITVCFSLGAFCHILPFSGVVLQYFAGLQIATSTAMTILVSSIAFMGLVLPFLFRFSEDGLQLLHIAANLGLAVVLIVLGLLNFSLGFSVAIIAVPLVILIPACFDNIGRLRLNVLRLYTLQLNPLALVFTVVYVLTTQHFVEISTSDAVARSITITSNAITYTIMDQLIYGNWLYVIVTIGFFPVWCLYWSVAAAGLVYYISKVKID